MDHPLVDRTLRTGYPEPQPRLIDYPSKVVYREDPLERMRRRKAKEKQKEPSA